MIVKELDRLEPSDKFEQAGYYAESQLAFYLKSEFKDDPQFLIFNNLRLVNADDVSQIDHLVLHRYGMIIIESKSVTTRVEVNEHGEWKRWFNNAWQGMPSPILQAQRQGKFLKDYLENHVENLLNKNLLGNQTHFMKMPIDVLVAISDAGIINRPQNEKLDLVCKADQVPDKVKEIATEYRKKDSLFNLSLEIPYEFAKDEIPRISQFLVTSHKPAATHKKTVSVAPKGIQKPEIKTKPIIKEAKPTAKNICSHCQSLNLSILYVHSYFFKCNDCGKNTAIKNLCPSCGDREKVRKSSLQFFTECEKCRTSRLFHTNSTNT